MPSSTETIPTPTQIAEDYKEISKQMQLIDKHLLPLKNSYTMSISAVDDIGQLSHLLDRVADTIEDDKPPAR
ncbi:hypothetical protein TrRE_jg4784 [Triparma retinervis]|uniref:Uncharacterized protein n=1 Tax=Triparma retinervis TaxID=2557542 RepID=A0A9W6ZA74_9STRA|nr:hypothetical protein TrRE_jg4784 [Triparma retinervis]